MRECRACLDQSPGSPMGFDTVVGLLLVSLRVFANSVGLPGFAMVRSGVKSLRFCRQQLSSMMSGVRLGQGCHKFVTHIAAFSIVKRGSWSRETRNCMASYLPDNNDIIDWSPRDDLGTAIRNAEWEISSETCCPRSWESVR
jgi:hypothetical protein